MFKQFFPRADYKTVYDVNYKKLYKYGIRGIIFDIDNTLVPYDMEEPPKEIMDLFDMLKEMGIGVCLVSNNNKKRVELFNRKLEVPAIGAALKPSRRNLRKAVDKIGVPLDQAAIVGDQIFTDVWGGNRLGIFTVLVHPIQQKEQFIAKTKRGLEKLVYKHYKKERRQNER